MGSFVAHAPMIKNENIESVHVDASSELAYPDNKIEN
jgi:hypothetical protein